MASNDNVLTNKSRESGPSFTLKNRLKRASWWLVYITMFRYTIPQMHAWRVLLLRLFGAQISNNCHVYPKVVIWAPWNLVMKNHSCLANNVTCYSQATITIEEYAIVSQGAHLCAGSHDYTDPDFQLIAIPIIIGKKAWVCAEAFVGPGVMVGEGSVLGARGVAMRNLLPWKVYSGNPAVLVKNRILKDV